MESAAAVPGLTEFGFMHGAARDAAFLAAVRAARRANALVAAMAGVVDRNLSYAEDGHSCSRAWVQAVTNSSPGWANHQVATARTVRAMPQLGQGWADGQVGESQIAEVVRLHGNSRCRDRLPESDAVLTDCARTLTFADFRTVCNHWRQLVDPDGSHRDHEAAHANRSVAASVLGASFDLHARGGNLDGAQIMQVLDEYADAEFRKDWAAAEAIHGEHTTMAHLARTARQRRFDAMCRVFQVAWKATGASTEPVPVGIIIDLETFEDELRRTAGLPVEPVDLETVVRRHCETTDGIPLDPQQVVAAALAGHVRRIVVNRAGIVVDAGRRQRLFRGAARSVVLATNHRCTWPGCGLPARQSQVDHATPFSERERGPTDAANANVLCARHNRFKQRGYRTWRDAAGQWHTIRPDGTEIAPRTDGEAGTTMPDAG